MTSLWEQVEPEIRERAYARLDNDPRSLLDGDSGGVWVGAEIILARLLGFDDQIVEDGKRLERAEPVLLAPIRQKLALAQELHPTPHLMLRTARYVLQRGYVLLPIDPMYAPPGVEPEMTTWTVRVLYLRYRRRS